MFYHEGILWFFKWLFCFSWDNHVFFFPFHSIDTVYYISWFSDFKSISHSWYKHQSIIVYNLSFMYYCIKLASGSLRSFTLIFIRDKTTVFFLCEGFCLLWYQDNTGLMSWEMFFPIYGEFVKIGINSLMLDTIH